METKGCLKIGTVKEFLDEAEARRINKTDCFGKWKVSVNGDMDYDNGRYFIEGSRLTEDNWILHLLDCKAWIDWNEFIPAYLLACKNAGEEFIKMRLFYK